MRWEALFDDLQAQADAMRRSERDGEVDERTRSEVGQLGVWDRLRTAVDAALRVRLSTGADVAGVVRRVGVDWFLVEEVHGREALLPAARVVSVRGLGRSAAVPGSAGVVESRLGFRQALRGIARDRSAVRIELTDRSTLDATVDRVGRDFVDVAAHHAAEPRRRTEVLDVMTVPLDAIVSVRRSA